MRKKVVKKKTVNKKKRLVSKRSFTAKNIQDVSTLAELLGDIIPATSFGNGFCFQKITKENGLSKFWKSGNKKSSVSCLIPNPEKSFLFWIFYVFEHDYEMTSHNHSKKTLFGLQNATHKMWIHSRSILERKE